MPPVEVFFLFQFDGSFQNECEVTKNEAFDETDKTGIKRSRSSIYHMSARQRQRHTHTTIFSPAPHSKCLL